MEQTGSNIKVIPLLVLLVLIGLSLYGLIMNLLPMPTITIPHALEHSESEEVIECITKGGTISRWQNLNNPKRWAEICLMPDGKYGVGIFEQELGFMKNISNFVKNKFTRIEQVFKYMTNSGYQCMWGCP